VSLMIPPKNLRLHWDAEHGWMLDVPFMLPDEVVRRVVRFSFPKQLDRFRSLPPGEKREQLKGALEKLQRFEVRQNIVGERGDGKGEIILHSAMKGA
jgi:hypothetical protein